MTTIKGFKVFYKDLTTRSGMSLKVGQSYRIPNHISLKDSAYHFCHNMEDGLCFFDKKEELEICEVLSDDEVIPFENDYYGYYELYAARHIELLKKLTRQEIIDNYKELAKNLYINEMRIARFLNGYQLTEEEEAYLGIEKKKLPFTY